MVNGLPPFLVNSAVNNIVEPKGGVSAQSGSICILDKLVLLPSFHGQWSLYLNF